MAVLPTTVKFAALMLLSGLWLALHQQVCRMDQGKIYHLAAYERDKRKARFYFLSVWIGLVVAAVSLNTQEALNGVFFDSRQMGYWVMGVVRGAGLWGLFMAMLVWSIVGQRASLVNSDGLSLMPSRDEKKQPNDSQRKK